MLQLCLLAILAAPRTIDLAWGSTPEGYPTASRYVSVQDTFLDASEPNANNGGAPILSGGPGRTILVRFGDLNAALGPVRVREARIELQLTGGAPVLPEGVRALNARWGEGPFPSLMSRITTTAKPGEAPALAATWRERLAGVSAWSQAGARGEVDGALLNGAARYEGQTLRVEGLAAAVQRQLDRPYENGGFALTFPASVEFSSAQGTASPRLVVEVEDAAPQTGPRLAVTAIVRDGANWVATVQNVGAEPAAPFQARWVTDDRPGSSFGTAKGLAPAETARFELAKPLPGRADPRRNRLRFEVVSESAGPDSALEIYESARPIAVDLGGRTVLEAQRAVTAWNDVWAAQSRFSFAPDGALDRVRLQAFAPGDLPTFRLGGTTIAQALGLGGARPAPPRIPGPVGTLSVANLEAQAAWPGETRYDGLIPGQSTLFDEPFPNPLALVPLPDPRLLNMAEVAILNSSLAEARIDAAKTLSDIAQTILLRPVDRGGRPVTGLMLSVYQVADGALSPTVSHILNAASSIILPGQQGAGPFGRVAADGSNGWLLLKAEANGWSDARWLRASQLVAAQQRARVPANIVEVRFNLPGAPFDPSGDLALNRIVSDSAGSPAASLAPLVNGQGNGAVSVAAQGWIELDLGRDRTFSAMEVVGGDPGPTAFDIAVYATGQLPSQAQAWTQELDFARAVRWRGASGTVLYAGPAIRARYVRFINRSTAPASIRALRIRPVRAAEGG